MKLKPAKTLFAGLLLILLMRASPAENPAVTDAPGFISIRTMRLYGPLERPEVPFLHDLHVNRLEKEKKVCATCHLTENGYLFWEFKRTGNPGKTELMEIYHKNCISCHQERIAENKKSGPVTCGECHVPSLGMIPEKDPMGFDRSLHFRHQKAGNDQCGKCHHEFDEVKKEKIVVKGKEGSCRYCHKKKDEENRISFQKAAHHACINCHLDRTPSGNSGPILCKGCHDPEEKKKIKIIDQAPRINRNQPDFLFVSRFKNAGSMGAEASEYRMNRVPFNHKGHEFYSDTCRVCHHAAISPCSSCHNGSDPETTGVISLEQAMHRPDSSISCIGCHEIRTGRTDCRGCHLFAPLQEQPDLDTCNICHIGVITEGSSAETVMKNSETAKNLLQELQNPRREPAPSEIPETVVIRALEDRYEPVTMPHGKILTSLRNRIKKDRLAVAFHDGDKTACKGCHHHSPMEVKPPQCGSCHGRPSNDEALEIPGLMAAYHRQCMECHSAMEITYPKNTDCTACHKEKPQRAL